MSKFPKTDRLRELREEKAGKKIIRGLEQALAYAKGEGDAKVTLVKVKPQKIAETKQAVESVSLTQSNKTKPKFDRNAYQRDLMKKRRAEQKAK